MVRVEWVDAYHFASDGAGGWAKTTGISTEECVVKTVGWMVKNDKRGVCITSSVNEDGKVDALLGGAIVIPKGCIRRIVRLRDDAA